VRILVATTAGAGHFAPLVPFARACARAGHRVRVAAPESFRGAVGQAGLDHAPVDDAPPEALREAMGRIPELTMREANELVVREVFGRIDAEAALPGLRTTVESWRPDVILREPAEVASYVVASDLGVPCVEVNIGLDGFADDLVTLLDEPLQALGCGDGSAGLREAMRWTLVPPSFDVDATTTTRRPVRFRYPATRPPTARSLPPWWAESDHDPLVYVTFGSVAAAIGLFPRFYVAVLEALREVPARVLMTLGEAGDPVALGALPGNVHVERWWPQDQVMQHAAAILGHGGFGTTMTALAAGLPQVVVPLFAGDQYENAARVHVTGAGVALQVDGVADRRAGDMVPSGPDVLDRLPAAVRAALHDDGLRRGAQAIAAEIAALPEPETCLPLLEELVGSR
jgi:UDP:flavonoid glycosyltransferase YjiC (YdhE family)